MKKWYSPQDLIESQIGSEPFEKEQHMQTLEEAREAERLLAREFIQYGVRLSDFDEKMLDAYDDARVKVDELERK